MEGKRKKAIIIVWVFLVMGMVWLFGTDRYIRSNIVTVDKADSIYIVTRDRTVAYPFDENLVGLVSYGGFVVKIDNFFVGLLAPYSNKLTKLDMKIRYANNGISLATADIFQSDGDPEGYILHMNNVYWSNGSRLVDLLELVE